MRRILVLILLFFALSQSVGCLLPIYSADPTRRTQQLLNVSENMRNLLDEWQRFWLIEQPSHLTPYRTHGGII